MMDALVRALLGQSQTMTQSPALDQKVMAATLEAPPPAGGAQAMSELDRARRLAEVQAVLERQRQMQEAAAGRQTGPNTEMQLMHGLMGLAAGGSMAPPPVTFNRGR